MLFYLFVQDLDDPLFFIKKDNISILYCNVNLLNITLYQLFSWGDEANFNRLPELDL